MSRPRCETVSSTEKGVYHIHSEFTQGFHYLGQDPVGKRFCGYRRQWIIDKCNSLCRTFPVTILSITVRTHCYDMVVRFDPTLPRRWSDREVVERWSRYFVLCRDDADKRRELTEEDFEEILDNPDRVADWRQRLCHLGGFMQELNGRVASRINRENGGGGALWARRYEAIALLDELAIVTALVNTAAEAVECRADGTLQITPYSTAYRYLHPTGLGWAESEATVDEFAILSNELPSLAWQTLWQSIEAVIDIVCRPTYCNIDYQSRQLEAMIGHLVLDTGLWIHEWIKRKDLPRRALGAPALLATLASKLGLKFLHLSWLGSGIYHGTKNQSARRSLRINQRGDQLPAAGTNPNRDPPPE